MPPTIKKIKKTGLSPLREAAPSRVFKTVKIVKDDGQGTEINFGYRIKRFKCRNGCEHHNHLICVLCGSSNYLDNALLENLQDALAKTKNFIPQKHDFQIYGVCRHCR